MNSQTFQVVLEGRTLAGQEVGQVAANLGQLFKRPAEQLVPLLQGKPLVIKRGLDETTALRYQTTIERAGAACRVELESLEVDLSSLGATENENPAGGPSPEPATNALGGKADDLSDLDAYYQQAFKEIDQQGGKMTVKWNWAAFLFGPFWYFYRRMWVKGLIIAFVILATGGLAYVVLWFYGGLFGTYDYYLLRKRNTQLWT